MTEEKDKARVDMNTRLEKDYQELVKQHSKENGFIVEDSFPPPCHNYRVTVEPVVFCYAFGILLHVPMIQQYIFYRVGESRGLVTTRTEHHSNCDNHSAHDNPELRRIMKDIQSETSFILLATIITSTIPTLIMTLMLGSWSDNVGRRTVIAIAIFGSILESSLILIIICLKLPIYFLMLSSFVGGICGYFPTIILSVFSYIADITHTSQRAFRLGVLEAVAFISGMISHLSSGWWIAKTGYVSPYWLITSLHFCAFLYTIFILPESRQVDVKRFGAGLCQFQHIQSIIQLFQEPRNGQRWKLVYLMTATACMMLSSTGFGCVFVLYALDFPLCFNSLLIGYYLATSFFIQAVGTVFGLKYLSLLLPQTVLAQIGVVSVILSLCCLTFVTNKRLLFAVPLIGCLGGIATPEVRAMMSEIVDSNEQGALFAAVAAVETVCTLLGAVIFNCLYSMSMHFGLSHFIFIAMASVLLIPFTILQIIRWRDEKYSKEDQDR
ncbi:proton-coupled folate transporter-like [Dendronephthya gigantea]|uniref:proton-coupled folate transporter-like n=1 Tax=Dendronephthya gigantea TaxID=151771 RepID=UPI0010692C03|nr:proton-coupled folate transporter-like [Dendronephthya gigantea]